MVCSRGCRGTTLAQWARQGFVLEKMSESRVTTLTGVWWKSYLGRHVWMKDGSLDLTGISSDRESQSYGVTSMVSSNPLTVGWCASIGCQTSHISESWSQDVHT